MKPAEVIEDSTPNTKTNTMTNPPDMQNMEVEDPEPRWPALVAVLCAGGLNYALPPELAFGPRWLLFAILGVLLVPTVLLHRAGQHRMNTIIGHLICVIMTAFMIVSVSLLVHALTNPQSHTLKAQELLHSAAFLWVTNVLVFASWYWRMDAGGPNIRELRAGHACGSFLFPQMTLDDNLKNNPDGTPWSPQFVDYLFLAFNTSTALSPADTAALSRWAKLLMMVQAMISLTIIVLLAARAVNILQ